MQATVFSFEPTTGAGTMVTDDGRTLAFDGQAFAVSGLRLLRPGQRVRAELSASGAVTALTILTLPDTWQEPDR